LQEQRGCEWNEDMPVKVERYTLAKLIPINTHVRIRRLVIS
jgi:hypothetical protein